MRRKTGAVLLIICVLFCMVGFGDKTESHNEEVKTLETESLEAERDSLWNSGNLSDWDSSACKDMQNIFSNAGSRATTFDSGDLSDWYASSMSYKSDAEKGRNVIVQLIVDILIIMVGICVLLAHVTKKIGYEGTFLFWMIISLVGILNTTSLASSVAWATLAALDIFLLIYEHNCKTRDKRNNKESEENK